MSMSYDRGAMFEFGKACQHKGKWRPSPGHLKRQLRRSTTNLENKWLMGLD